MARQRIQDSRARCRARPADSKHAFEHEGGLEALEPRLLLSADLTPGMDPDSFAQEPQSNRLADPVPTEAALLRTIGTEMNAPGHGGHSAPQDGSPPSIDLDKLGWLHSRDLASSSSLLAKRGGESVTTAADTGSARAEIARTEMAPTEIIFVDRGVEGYESLISDIASRMHDGRTIEVHLLDRDRDGIEQITDVLATRSDLQALHIVSHGSDGELVLGNTSLSNATLGENRSAIASWSAALTQEADLLIYGCNVAERDDGRAFVGELGALTGADVAASADLTGAAALGGDWELEHAVGHIETKIAFGEQLRHGWMSTLDVLALQQGVSGYSATIDTELDASLPIINHGGNAEIEVDDSPQRQALIRFADLNGTGANQIPAGATIHSATLTLEVTNATAVGNLDVHKMLVDWTEASTWSSTVGGVQLDDVEAESTRESRLANADQTGPQSFEDLAGSVQRWVDGEANYGWVIVNDDPDLWRFATSEHGTVSIRPTLTVDYTPALDTTLRVNTEAGDVQQTAETGGKAVARAPNGNSIVVWSSLKQDGSGFGVYAQLFAPTGARIGAEIPVNTHTDGNQLNAAVAADNTGNFVVVWQSEDEDGDGFGIYAQRFDASGSKLGLEITVNTQFSMDQTSPAVAMDADGDFVVVWQSDRQDGDGWGVYAQRFDAAGSHVGSERLVNTFTSFDQFDPSVAMDAGGDYVVTWTADKTPGGDRLDIRGQRFDTLGNAQGLEFQINSSLANDQFDSSVTMNDAGDFVVVWTSDGQDGDAEGIYGRTYNRDGSARGDEFSVPTLFNKEQEHATVAMQSDGDFIVSWTHRDTDSIYHRQFNLDGIAQGAQVLVDTDTNNQKNASVSIDDSNRISVVWSADHPSNDNAGVYIKLSALDSNLKPTLTLPGPAINYAESDPATILDAAATVADFDSPDFEGGSLTIEFTSGGTTNDRLEIRHQGTGAAEIAVSGSTVSYGAVDIGTFSGGTDGTTPLVVSLNAAANLAATEALARSITYRNMSEGPSTNARQVRVYLDDGSGGVSLAASKDINVSIVNDPPMITAPASENTVENTRVTFEPPGNAISINDADIGSEELKITLSVTHGELDLGATNNLAFLVGDGNDDQIMVFTGTQADVNDALDGLEFTPTNLFVGTAQISLDVDDQGASGSGGAQITSTAINVIVASDGDNDRPKILDPGMQSTVEDQPLFFSVDNANLFQLQDDAGGSPVEVTLGVTDGTLTLSGTTGLTFSTGDGTGDPGMTLTGTIANINAAINGMYFQPTLGFVGTATLDLDISDLGNTGGNPLAPETDNASIDIDVDVRNRAPSVAGPAAVVTVEATPFIFSAADLISFGDVDHGNQDLEVTLSVTHGTLTLSTTVGLGFTVGDGTNDAAMTFKGKLSELNPALNGLSFTPYAAYAGGAVLQIGINDLGNTGAGGALTDQHTVSIDITPDGSNAAPLNSVPGTQVTKEETPLVFSDTAGNQISVNDDIGAGNLTVTLTATDGTVSLSNTVGSEFQINTDVSGNQDDAQTAMAPDGRFVVVWTSAGQDGSGDGIYVQLYDASGTATGGEIRINATTAGNQYEPAVAMDVSGNFVVVWTSDGQDGSSRGVYARLFDATGTPASGEFLVNSQTANEQRNAAVAMDADGDFAVVWQSKSQDGGDSWGVYGKRFDAAGTALDVPAGPPGVKEFRVNTETANDQHNPVIAMDDAGNFAVAWQSKNQDGDDHGIFAKRYDAAGNELDSPLPPPAEAEFQINTVSFKDQTSPSLAMDSDGDFVIAWQSSKQDHPSGDKAWGVFGQRFDATGNAQGVNFLVNSSVTRDQQAPTVAMDADGAFVIAWQAEKQDHADKKEGVYAQRYDAAGGASGKEFLVNTTTAKEQRAPSIALGSDGKFATAWQSKGQDQGDSWGVYGQRYDDIRSLGFLIGDGEDDVLVSFQGTVDEINDALNGLVFTPNVDFVGTASLNIVTDDGVTAADDDTVDITVNPVNDEPTISTLALATADEGVPFVFSTAGGNPVIVGDIDIAGAEPVKIVLLATQGTLSLNGTAGLSFSVGDGANDAAMTFTGSLANVNAALDGMSFIALPTFAGDASMQISIDDQGNIGSEPALSASATVPITITANSVNDAPVIALPGPQRIPVNTALVLGESDNTLVSISDDAASNPVQATLTVTNGTVSLSQLVSSEQQVNSYFTGNQQAASVATAADGTYVVVWQSNAQDGDVYGIYGQRYTAQGQPAGSEFRVNTTTVNDQRQPVVARSANGQFAVAWQSNAQDGNGQGVYVRTFDTNGMPLSDEVLVNAFTQGNQTNPSIAIDGTGNFVVAWESAEQDGNGLGVVAQRFDAGGAALGSEFQVNSVTASNQRNASVAMNADGEFVIAWQGKDVAGEGILAQRYDADGNTLGGEFLVTSVTLDNQILPDVAMDDAGNFIVVWQSQNEDGNGAGIFARRFDATGLPQGANFGVTTTTAGSQTAPSVDMNATGEFFVVWQDNDANGQGIFGQRFAANGTALGTQLSLNTTPAGDQEASSAAIDDNGNVITVWTSGSNQDGNGEGIFSQRLANFGGLTFISGDGERDSTVVFRGALADINDALANMTFTPQTGFTGLATIRVDVDDLGNSGSGGPLSDSETLDIIVGGGPLMDLDADNSSGGVGSNFAAVFAAGAVPIADTDALISDLNTGNLISLTVTISNQIDGIDEKLAANTAGTSIFANYDDLSGVLSLTGLDTLAQYEQVLRSISYENTAATPSETTRIITFIANDGSQDSNLASATVEWPNTLPTASNSTVVANEDAAHTFSVADFSFSDPNGDSLAMVRISAVPSVGSLELSGTPVVLNQEIDATDITSGFLKFVPVPSANGSGYDSFDFQVHDGSAYSLNAYTMSVDVGAVGDTPQVANISTLEDIQTGAIITDRNANDGAEVTHFRISNIIGGSLYHNDGTTPISNGDFITYAEGNAGLKFTPDLNRVLPTSFDVEASEDGVSVAAQSGVATSTITITPVNDDPDTAGESVSTGEDSIATTPNLLANDTDPDSGETATLTINEVNGVPANVGTPIVLASGATLTVNANGTWLYDPSTSSTFNALALGGPNGADSFNYTVTDVNGATSTAAVNLTITPMNDGPTATGESVTTDEDSVTGTGSGEANLLANDTDPDSAETATLSIAEVNGVPANVGTPIVLASGATLTVNANGTWVYDPSTSATFNALALGGPNGADSFNYTVTDVHGATSTATMNLTITPGNDGPTATGESVTTDEDSLTGSGSGEANLLANDTDPDSGESATLSIAEVNGMPANVGTPIVLASGATLTVNANGSWVYDPSTSATFNALALGGPNGADSFNYTVTDVHGATSTATMNLTITPGNDGPTASGESVTTDEDSLTGTGSGEANLLANDTDPDSAESATLSIAEINGVPANVGTPIVLASGATLTVNANGSWVYDPSTSATFNALALGGPNGADSFNYTVSDVHGATSTATMNLTITPGNDGPTASGESVTTDEDSLTGTGSGEANLLANDTDPDSAESATLSIAEVNGVPANVGTPIVLASGATLTVNANGSWVYDPSTSASLQALATGGPNGADSFNYTVSDVHGATSSATVNLTITPINDAPMLDNTGAMVLGDVLKDSSNPPGTSVASMISSAGGDRITDVDTTAVEGIAVIGVDNTDGIWEYSVNAGASWRSFAVDGVADGITDDSAAVLLDTSALLRFVPGAGYTGPAGAVSFHAWDRTSGASGDTTVNISGTGGVTAYSTVMHSATLNVVVADFVLNQVPGAQATDEDSALTFSVGNGNAVRVSDGSVGNPTLRTTLVVTNGTLTLSTTAGLVFEAGGDGTSTMTIVGLESAINTALDGLRFDPTADVNGPANLQITTALGSDPLARYSFDNLGDPGNDDGSSGAFDASTVSGATATVDGTRGNVLAFDGMDDFMSVNGRFGDPANVTLAGWVNLDVATNKQELVSLGDNIAIRLNEDGGTGVKGFFHIGGSWRTTLSNIDLGAGSWHHVAYSFDDAANEQVLYIDGVVVATTSHSESITYGLGPDTILGRNGNNPTEALLDGKLDDVRVYDRALSAGEIVAISKDRTSDTDNIAISINPVNDGPTANIAPAAYAVNENSPFSLHGTGLSVSDADAGGSPLRVTVSVGEGSLNTSAGSTGVAISGTGTTAVTLDGTLAQINDLLAGNNGGTLSYSAIEAPSASTLLTLAIDDLGNVGGGSLTAADIATLNITAENDAPAASGEGVTTDEDMLTGTGTGEANLLANDTDPDSGESATLSIAEVNGVPANVGTPIVLASGATLTVTPTAPGSTIPAPRRPSTPSPSAGRTAPTASATPVTDVHGATSNATMTLTITPANDAPSVLGESVTTDEDSVTGTGTGSGSSESARQRHRCRQH